MTESRWPEQISEVAQQSEVPISLEGKAAVLADGVRISANSDVEAVAAWLEEYRDSAQTLRAYRKEAERLLLWLDSQGQTLGSLRRDGLDDFEAFLADPRPAARWIGPPRPRHADDWRPFRRPLSAASRRQSLVILQGLYSWLVEAGWVDHNPFRLMRGKRRRLDNRQEGIERYLERPLWEWFWGWLNQPLARTVSPRQRFEWQRRRMIFGFAYLLAPRISEMAAARMGDFQRREGRWWWRVIGKGSKLATIPVPPDMMALLGDWVRDVPFFGFVETSHDGIPFVLCRSGWSGQGGFELFLQDGSRGLDLWDAVWAAGEKYGIHPGGPTPNERIESDLFSYRADCGAGASPLEVGLEKFLSLGRDDEFIGKVALLAERSRGPARRLVKAMLSGERLLATSESPWPAYGPNGSPCGEVRVAVWSPRHDSNLCLALVSAEVAGGPFSTVTPTGEALQATHHHFFAE